MTKRNFSEQKALAKTLIDTILSHEDLNNESSLLEKCEPLIQGGAFLTYSRDDGMTAGDWAKFFGYETLLTRICSAISQSEDITRSKKRAVLSREFRRAEEPSLRDTLSRYWKEATRSNHEIYHDNRQPPPAP